MATWQEKQEDLMEKVDAASMYDLEIALHIARRIKAGSLTLNTMVPEQLTLLAEAFLEADDE